MALCYAQRESRWRMGESRPTGILIMMSTKHYLSGELSSWEKKSVFTRNYIHLSSNVVCLARAFVTALRYSGLPDIFVFLN
jgi:hypothetical protein